MLKQFKRWLVATLALTMIALAALLTPILSSHAAAPHASSNHNVIHSKHHDIQPDWFNHF